MRIIRIICLFVVALLVNTSYSNLVLAENLPKFTGIYLTNGTSLNQLTPQELTLSEVVDGRLNRIPGYQKIPTDINTKSKRPNIIFYAGQTEGITPTSIALVKLKKTLVLGYQRDSVMRKYREKLWIFEKEIGLRYAPVDGKIGMWRYEPTDDLAPGLYCVDIGSGILGNHNILKTLPSRLGIYTLTDGYPVALPFVVGNISDSKD